MCSGAAYSLRQGTCLLPRASSWVNLAESECCHSESEFSFHCGRAGRWQCLRRGGTVLQGQESLPGTQQFVPAQSLARGRYSNACWIKDALEGQGGLAVETKPQEMGSGDGDVMSWGTGSQDLTSSFWICRELWFAGGPVVLVSTCLRSQWWLELL